MAESRRGERKGALTGVRSSWTGTLRPFECVVESHCDAVVIRPSGELDIDTVETFTTTVREVDGAGFDRVVLDLRALTFIDCSGLRAVLAATRSAAPRSRLEIVPGPDAVQRIFRVAGVLDQLPFVDATTDREFAPIEPA